MDLWISVNRRCEERQQLLSRTDIFVSMSRVRLIKGPSGRISYPESFRTLSTSPFTAVMASGCFMRKKNSQKAVGPELPWATQRSANMYLSITDSFIPFLFLECCICNTQPLMLSSVFTFSSYRVFQTNAFSFSASISYLGWRTPQPDREGSGHIYRTHKIWSFSLTVSTLPSHLGDTYQNQIGSQPWK